MSHSASLGGTLLIHPSAARFVRLERVDLPVLEDGSPPEANDHDRRRRDNGARQAWRLVRLDGSRLADRDAGLFVSRAAAGVWAHGHGYELEEDAP
jgi:hypothetical protein